MDIPGPREHAGAPRLPVFEPEVLSLAASWGTPPPETACPNADPARNGRPTRSGYLTASRCIYLYIKSPEVLLNGQNRSSTRRFCPISRISIFCRISRCGNMDVSGLAAQPIPASGNLGHSFQHNPRFCECTGSSVRSPAVSCRLPTEVFHRQLLSRT